MLNTVFILGAGASVDAGCPTMATFLDRAREYYSNSSRFLESEDKKAFETVFEAIYELQGIHFKSKLDLNNIEEVFGAVDMARLIGKLGSMSAEKIEEIYHCIERLILLTLDNSVTLAHDGQHYHLKGSYNNFAKKIVFNENIQKDKISIVTFNYDIALDYVLQYYSVNDNNYYLKEPTTGIPFLKLHGSLNWGKCQKCNEVYAWPLADFLRQRDQGLPKGQRLINVGYHLSNYQHMEGHYLKGPVLVPPTWAKYSFYDALKHIWNKAAQVLSDAEAIYVIGYSLPETDMFFRYLFALGTHSKQSIRRFCVFDPDPTGQVEKRFESLLGPGIAKPRFSFFKNDFHSAVNIIASYIQKD